MSRVGRPVSIGRSRVAGRREENAALLEARREPANEQSQARSAAAGVARAPGGLGVALRRADGAGRALLLGQLQRTLGNGQVQRLVASLAVQRAGAGEHKQVNEDEEPIERQVDRTLALQRQPAGGGVRLILQREATLTFPVDRPPPKRSNTDPSTTSVESNEYDGEISRDRAANVYRYNLKTFESKGKIQIVYYTNDHYPAPTPTDDSGPLSNVTKDNWEDVADDLHANRTGIADDWSAYRAEELHENYHWYTEWVNLFTPELRKVEKQVNSLTVPAQKGTGLFGRGKKRDVSIEEAATELRNKARKIISATVKNAKKRYYKLPDSPGDPAYVAQAPAIDAMERRVRNYGAILEKTSG